MNHPRVSIQNVHRQHTAQEDHSHHVQFVQSPFKLTINIQGVKPRRYDKGAQMATTSMTTPQTSILKVTTITLLT